MSKITHHDTDWTGIQFTVIEKRSKTYYILTDDNGCEVDITKQINKFIKSGWDVD